MSSFVQFTCCPCTKEKSFPGYYTGRRMRFTDGKLVFEGDLQEIGDNLIYGFFGLHFHHFYSTKFCAKAEDPFGMYFHSFELLGK